MNTALETPIMSDFRVILIDETEHWTPELQAKCGKIYTVCLYDNNVDVYCCELTPSKELHPIGYHTENAIDDETDEILRDTFARVEESVKYMKLLPESQRTETKQSDNIEFTDARSEEYNEHVESLIEAYNANPDYC